VGATVLASVCYLEWKNYDGRLFFVLLIKFSIHYHSIGRLDDDCHAET
jgi:hypothetical protein